MFVQPINRIPPSWRNANGRARLPGSPALRSPDGQWLGASIACNAQLAAHPTMIPFGVVPVYVERPWGGRQLEHYGKDLPAGKLIGESWELADLDPATTNDDLRTRVANGPWTGLTLSEVIAMDSAAFLGAAAPTPDGSFPLLVKYLDVREPLSVQVHPPSDYVQNHPGTHRKTESWYVVEADESAGLWHGLIPEATTAELEVAVGTAAVVPLLQERDAVAGEFHHVPAGLAHSLTGNQVVAEVQTPSDTTFRMYDWNAELGRPPRPMHRDEALEAVRLDVPSAFSLPAVAKGARQLIDTDDYWIREHRQQSGGLRLAETDGPTILMVVDGRVDVESMAFRKGATVVVPADCAEPQVSVVSPTTVLEIGLV